MGRKKVNHTGSLFGSDEPVIQSTESQPKSAKAKKPKAEIPAHKRPLTVMFTESKEQVSFSDATAIPPSKERVSFLDTPYPLYPGGPMVISGPVPPEREQEVFELYERGDSKPKKIYQCEFVILVDSREQLPYRFDNITTNADKDYSPIIVTTERFGLPVGDYAIKSLPGIIIERKSKEDFFGTVANNAENMDKFEHRLSLMSDNFDYAAVVVEAEESEIRSNPPEHSEMNPKSLLRKVLAWRTRYHVDWYFTINRATAEQTTFRLLERYYNDHGNSRLSHSRVSVEAFQRGIAARLDGHPVATCPYSAKSSYAAQWGDGWSYCDLKIIQRNLTNPSIRICNGSCHQIIEKNKAVKKTTPQGRLAGKPIDSQAIDNPKGIRRGSPPVSREPE